MADDDKVDYYLCMTEFNTRLGHIDRALDDAAKGIELEPSLSKEGKKKGAVPMILYMAANIHANRGDLERAKTCLKWLRAHGTHYSLHPLIYLKDIVLAQKLGEEFISDYTALKVHPGAVETVTMHIGKEMCQYLYLTLLRNRKED